MGYKIFPRMQYYKKLKFCFKFDFIAVPQIYSPYSLYIQIGVKRVFVLILKVYLHILK